jgi:hypothetical protein
MDFLWLKMPDEDALPNTNNLKQYPVTVFL